MIEFGILGPLLVRRNERQIDISAPMLQRMIALLVCHRGQPVHMDTLADALWDGRPPRTARKTLQVYAHRLRRLLGDEGRIRFSAGGYALTISISELDAERFETVVTEANQARQRGDLEVAARLFDDALALWRGEAYADVRQVALVDAERQRLADRRLTVLEAHLQVRLDLGEHDRMLSELTKAVEEHPFREDLRAQLILALYRSGRRADALEVYRATRRLLSEELGVDPMPRLQRLHQQVLADDPELDLVGVPGRNAAAEASRRFLPYDIPDFVGRDNDIRWLDETSSADGARTMIITAIAGTAGVGKTALAVRWAHLRADRFADGQLYVNLRGYEAGLPLRPIEALTHHLRCLGVPAEKLPVDLEAAAALYRSMLAGKRMIILLDNARTPDQIRPLLPGDPGCLVIVTSRDKLTGLVATEGAQRMTLGLLVADEAVVLLRRILGEERVDAEPHEARRLAELCGRLPLAIRIAAARLADQPDKPIGRYADELERGGRLGALTLPDDEHRGLKAVLDQSYSTLPDRLQRALPLLGLFPGPDFTAETTAPLLDCDLDEAASILDALNAAHLIEQQEPGRYNFHDLVREYAAAVHADDARPRAEPMRRLFDFFQAAATDAHSRIDSSAVGKDDDGVTARTARQAMDWLDAERLNLIAAVTSAAAHAMAEQACAIAQPLWTFFFHAGYTSDWISTFECAFAAIDGVGDDTVKYFVLNALGSAYVRAGQYEKAMRAHQECIAARESMGDRMGVAKSRSNLAMSYERLGSYEAALDELTRALAIYQSAGDLGMELMLLGTNLPNVLNRMGRHEEAAEHIHRALRLLPDDQGSYVRARTVQNLGNTYLRMNDPAQALPCLEEALRFSREVGDQRLEMLTIATLGEAHVRLGDYELGIDYLLQGIEWSRKKGVQANVCEDLNGLGEAYAGAGRLADAKAAFAEAHSLAVELGLEHQRAYALAGLARLGVNEDPGLAKDRMLAALSILKRLSPREAADLSRQIGALGWSDTTESGAAGA